MPPLHPLVVHFPIALFCIGVLLDCITAYRLRGVPKSDRHSTRAEIGVYNPANRLIMILGFVGTLVAIVSGEWLKAQRGSYLPHGLLTLHQWLAFLFALWYAGILLLRLRRHWRPTKGYLALALSGVIVLTAVGHTGGTMAWPATHAVSPSGLTGSASSGTTSGQTSSGDQPAAENGLTGPDSSGKSGTSSNKSKPSFILKTGDRGQKVSQLQQQLTELGYFKHAVTEYYGPTTTASVQAFQKAKQLPVTGNLDQNTLNDILKELKQKNLSAGTSSTQSTTSSQRTSKSTASHKAQSSVTKAQTSSIDQARYDNGYRLFVSSCQSCHSLSLATQYYGKLSDSQWQQVVSQMQSYAGGSIPITQDILYYLDHHK